MIGHLIQMVRLYAGPTVERLRDEESGVTAIEYGLLAALIAVVIIAGAMALGVSLNDLFGGLATDVSSTSS